MQGSGGLGRRYFYASAQYGTTGLVECALRLNSQLHSSFSSGGEDKAFGIYLSNLYP